MGKLAGFLAVLALIGLVVIGWGWISQNANTITAVATSIGLVGLALYVWATWNLWRETKTSVILAQLPYSPQVTVTLEDPSQWGYSLVFRNHSQQVVLLECEMFVDFNGFIAGQRVQDNSTTPVKRYKLTLASGSVKKVPVDTFGNLKLRGLGQYTPHRLTIKGTASVKASLKTKHPIRETITEVFECFFVNEKTSGDVLPIKDMLDPQKWEWRWRIWAHSEQQIVTGESIESWPEEQLPDEYKPCNNNTDLYKRIVLQKQYGELVGAQPNREIQDK